MGITTDYDGNVWFGQTNTGRVAMFDPVTEEFAEYDNPTWPLGTRSMMWGMAYAPDGHVWYTDDTYDSLWRFSPATGEYERLQFPSDGDSLPQKLEIDGSQIIVNDFTGNKLTFFSSSPNTSEISYLNIPSPFNGSQAADFAVDPDNNVWFTTWSLQSGGILVKFDQDRYLESISNPLNVEFPLFSYMEIFGFPANMLTPNGAAITPDGTLWLADTTSSSFYSFDPATEQFIQYVHCRPAAKHVREPHRHNQISHIPAVLDCSRRCRAAGIQLPGCKQPVRDGSAGPDARRVPRPVKEPLLERLRRGRRLAGGRLRACAGI